MKTTSRLLLLFLGFLVALPSQGLCPESERPGEPESCHGFRVVLAQALEILQSTEFGRGLWEQVQERKVPVLGDPWESPSAFYEQSTQYQIHGGSFSIDHNQIWLPTRNRGHAHDPRSLASTLAHEGTHSIDRDWILSWYRGFAPRSHQAINEFVWRLKNYQMHFNKVPKSARDPIIRYTRFSIVIELHANLAQCAVYNELGDWTRSFAWERFARTKPGTSATVEAVDCGSDREMADFLISKVAARYDLTESMPRSEFETAFCYATQPKLRPLRKIVKWIAQGKRPPECTMFGGT